MVPRWATLGRPCYRRRHRGRVGAASGPDFEADREDDKQLGGVFGLDRWPRGGGEAGSAEAGHQAGLPAHRQTASGQIPEQGAHPPLSMGY